MKKEESTQKILTSSIENRHLVSQIAQREWVSATESLVSDRFAKTEDCELAVKSSQSRGKTLVKKMSSLKNAFILSEILHRTIE